MRNWRVDFSVLLIVQLVASAGFMVAGPFVPLYIQDLGANGVREAAVWAGIMGAMGGLTLAVASPFWGAVADRYGRKLMLERATIGAAVFQGGMGLVSNVAQLVVLRTLQSVVSGVQAAAMALAACIVPQASLGFALGALQTASALGSTLGPFVGGWMAASLGYRPTFYVTGVMLFLAGVLTFFAVHEDAPPDCGKRQSPALAGLREVLAVSTIPLLLLVVALSRAAGQAVSIAIPLMLQEMAGGSRDVAGPAGTVAGLSAAAMAVGAVLWGRLGDRLGQARVMMMCLILSAAAAIPQTLVQAPWQLAVGQMIYAAMLAGLIPTGTALIGIMGPKNRHGVVYGASGTALALGNAFGPTLAAGLIGVFGTRSLFFGIGLLLLVLYLVVSRSLKPAAPLQQA